MNFGLFRILRENLVIFRRRFVPVVLRFKRLSLQLFRLWRLRSHSCQLLGGARGELRVIMRGRIKYVRIAGEFAVQQQQGFYCRLRLIETHGTTRH